MSCTFTRSKQLNCDSKNNEFYSLGYLGTSLVSSARVAQGLDQQVISNACAGKYNSPNYCLQGCGVNCFNKFSKCACDCTENLDSQAYLYPMKPTPLPTYGMKPLTDDYYCTLYVQPP